MPGAPNPATAGQNIPGQASPLQLAAAWIQAGGPVDQTTTAVAVALAESGGKLTAINHDSNGSTDYGPWQVNSINGGSTADYNIGTNAKNAVSVYNSQGWGAWSTYKNGKWKTFYFQGLNAAQVATSSTANQLAGALIPLLGVAGAAALPGEVGAAEATAGAGGAGGGLSATSLASKAGQAYATGKQALGIAALASVLLDPKHWLRILMVVGGILLILVALIYMVRTQIMK